MAEVTGLEDFDPLRAVALGSQIEGQRERLDLANRRFTEQQAQNVQRTERQATIDDLTRARTGLDITMQAIQLPFERFQAALPLISQSGLVTEDDVAALSALTADDLPKAAQDLQGKAKEVDQLINMLPNMTEEEKERAITNTLGLTPRAMGSASQTIAEGNLEDRLADVEATLAGGEAAGKQAIEKSGDAFDQLAAITASLANYDEAIQALDDGAQTGVIESRFPSIRESSIRLENAANRLGLDIVSATTFGALSEGELALAKAVAMPTNLEPLELRKWLVDRRNAQEKLARELRKMAIFLGTPGNTTADYLRQLSEKGQYATGEGGGVSVGRFTVEVE